MRPTPLLPTALILSGLSSPAAAQGTYFDTRQILNAFFASSERVSYETLQTAEIHPALERYLGYVPPRDAYVIFVAHSGERIDGYAVIDNEPGQHLPITLATQITPGGRVVRTEIMVYREGYGDEIRELRFRNQLVGLTLEDPIRLGDDVDAISGATISSRAMTVAIRRALALVRVLREGKSAPSAARHPR